MNSFYDKIHKLRMHKIDDRIENDLCFKRLTLHDLKIVTYVNCPIFTILVYKTYKCFYFQCIIYNGDSDLF